VLKTAAYIDRYSYVSDLFLSLLVKREKILSSISKMSASLIQMQIKEKEKKKEGNICLIPKLNL
jgi:hypothetical protein